MTTKIVENVDDEIWRVFGGYCKIYNKSVGQGLNEILKEFNARCERTKKFGG